MRRGALILSTVILVLGAFGFTVGFAESPPPSEVHGRYLAYCHACHGTGAADAPMTNDADDWGPRLETGMDTLVARTRAGRYGMPAMGRCYECTDADFEALIRYMARSR